MNDSERIKMALEGSPYYQLRTIEVHMEDEKVILTGIVRSFYMKQMAQESVRLDGSRIVNRIIVES